MKSLCQRYKPTFDDMMALIKPSKKKLMIEQFYNSGYVPGGAGIVLSGPGGAGKTTIANLIAQSPQNWDVRELPTTGEKAKQVKFLLDELCYAWHPVLIIGNEIDKSDRGFVDGLRGIIDLSLQEKLSPIRFLFTTNQSKAWLSQFSPQMFDPDEGRMNIIEIDKALFDINAIFKRLQFISNSEGYTLSDQQLLDIIQRKTPSIRNMLRAMEAHHYGET